MHLFCFEVYLWLDVVVEALFVFGGVLSDIDYICGRARFTSGRADFYLWQGHYTSRRFQLAGGLFYFTSGRVHVLGGRRAGVIGGWASLYAGGLQRYSFNFVTDAATRFVPIRNG